MRSPLIVCVIVLLPSFTVHGDELGEIRDAIIAQEHLLDDLKARLIRLEEAAGLKAPALTRTIESNDTKNIGKKALLESYAPKIKVAWAGSSPKFSDSKNGFSFKSRGKLQAEFMTSSSNRGEVDYGRATEIRRARLGAQGSIDHSLDYVAEIDFSNKKVGFEDIFIRYRLSDHSSIRLGHHEASVSLDDETSDSSHSFLERSLHNAMSLGRSVGLGLETQGSWWSFNTGLYGEPESDTEPGQDEGWRMSARFMFTPLQDEDQVLHFGTAAYYLSVDDDGDYSVKAKPESHQLAALFDTGNHAANDARYVGIETAFQHKNILLQAEFGRQTVDYSALHDSNFVSGYLQAAWIITGEQRNYHRRRGKFGGIVPIDNVSDGGLGAIEVALRSSYMDLVSGDISGGKGGVLSLGLNWYPSPYLRMSANWLHFDLDRSAEVFPQGSSEHQGDSIVLRSQLTW